MRQQDQNWLDDLSRIKYEVERFRLTGDVTLYEDSHFISTLEPAQSAVEFSYGKLVLSCWGEGWSRCWRIIGCLARADQIQLACTKQASHVRCSIVLRRGDLPEDVSGSRVEFAGRLSALIETNLPGLRVVRLMTARDDSRHLSGIHARVILKKGRETVAGIAVSRRESQSTIDATLSAGLIWLEALRRSMNPVKRLLLLAPRGSVFNLACRLLYVRHEDARIILYETDEADGRIEPVAAFAQSDLADGLKRAARHADWQVAKTPSLSACQQLRELTRQAPDLIDQQMKNGWIQLSVRGLNFARLSMQKARLEFGLQSPRKKLTEHNQPELQTLISNLVTVRRPGADNRNATFYRAQPERWLESVVRRDLTAIDVMLDRRYVYTQVPAYRGEQRSFIDLLGVTRAGRLAVIELKVSEDIEFPFQGLDYWLRVDWHRRRGDFERRGFFKGSKVSDEPPLIYLVAPLFRFHATTRLLASAIVKDAPVYRIGINEDWRSGIQVLLRERLN